VGSETYPQDLPQNWKLVEELPYLVGDFMWTAWDYLGEVGIGAWTWESDGKGFEKPYPWLLADCGAIDYNRKKVKTKFLPELRCDDSFLFANFCQFSRQLCLIGAKT